MAKYVKMQLGNKVYNPSGSTQYLFRIMYEVTFLF